MTVFHKDCHINLTFVHIKFIYWPTTGPMGLPNASLIEARNLQLNGASKKSQRQQTAIMKLKARQNMRLIKSPRSHH